MNINAELETKRREIAELKATISTIESELDALTALVKKIDNNPQVKITCRGSFQLNTACGHCERCVNELLILLRDYTITPEGVNLFPVNKEQVAERIAKRVFDYCAGDC